MPTLQEQINAASSGAVITLPDNSEHIGNFVIDKALTIQSNPNAKAIIRTPNAAPAIHQPPKTGPVVLRGVEPTTAPGWAEVYDIVRCGDWQTTSLADVPQGLVIEHCDIHGQPGQDLQRGVAANGANVVIRNNKIREIHNRGADSQAVGAWNGPGPFTIEDNYLEASGENVMFGGAEAMIQGLIPTNIQVRRNHMFKPLSWHAGDPSYAGIPWIVKNLFELKNARNVIVEGNILENCWLQAQVGYAVLFTVRGEDGKNPWATLENVVFRNNIIKNVPAGFQLIGKDAGPSQQATGLNISNNLIQFGTGLGSTGRLLQMQQYNNVVFENNEADPPHTHLVMSGQDSAGAPLLNKGLIYRNNLLKFGEYGIFTDGDKPYTAYAPDGVITGNYIYGPSIPAARKIAGNSYFDMKPTTVPAGVGVNYEALKAAQAGTGSVIEPVPAPSPEPEPAPAPSAPEPTPTPTPPSVRKVAWPKAESKHKAILDKLWVDGYRLQDDNIYGEWAIFEKVR